MPGRQPSITSRPQASDRPQQLIAGYPPIAIGALATTDDCSPIVHRRLLQEEVLNVNNRSIGWLTNYLAIDEVRTTFVDTDTRIIVLYTDIVAQVSGKEWLH
jgi:hypothetical protein